MKIIISDTSKVYRCKSKRQASYPTLSIGWPTVRAQPFTHFTAVLSCNFTNPYAILAGGKYEYINVNRTRKIRLLLHP